jgi:hypothetical protein
MGIKRKEERSIDARQTEGKREERARRDGTRVQKYIYNVMAAKTQDEVGEDETARMRVRAIQVERIKEEGGRRMKQTAERKGILRRQP